MWGNNHQDPSVESYSDTTEATFPGQSNPLEVALAWKKAITPPSGTYLPHLVDLKPDGGVRGIGLGIAVWED